MSCRVVIKKSKRFPTAVHNSQKACTTDFMLGGALGGVLFLDYLFLDI